MACDSGHRSALTAYTIIDNTTTANTTTFHTGADTYYRARTAGCGSIRTLGVSPFSSTIYEREEG